MILHLQLREPWKGLKINSTRTDCATEVCFHNDDDEKMHFSAAGEGALQKRPDDKDFTPPLWIFSLSFWVWLVLGSLGVL